MTKSEIYGEEEIGKHKKVEEGSQKMKRGGKRKKIGEKGESR